jgi:hypothetical protein
MKDSNRTTEIKSPMLRASQQIVVVRALHQTAVMFFGNRSGGCSSRIIPVSSIKFRGPPRVVKFVRKSSRTGELVEFFPLFMRHRVDVACRILCHHWCLPCHILLPVILRIGEITMLVPPFRLLLPVSSLADETVPHVVAGDAATR